MIKLEKLVYVHYNMRLRARNIEKSVAKEEDYEPINLDYIFADDDPLAPWLAEIEDPALINLDLNLSDNEGQGPSQAGSSRRQPQAVESSNEESADEEASDSDSDGDGDRDGGDGNGDSDGGDGDGGDGDGDGDGDAPNYDDQDQGASEDRYSPPTRFGRNDAPFEDPSEYPEPVVYRRRRADDEDRARQSLDQYSGRYGYGHPNPNPYQYGYGHWVYGQHQHDSGSGIGGYPYPNADPYQSHGSYQYDERAREITGYFDILNPFGDQGRRNDGNDDDDENTFEPPRNSMWY